jgi:hypothetical protein
MRALRWGALAGFIFVAACGDDGRGDDDAGAREDTGRDACEGVVQCASAGASCEGDLLVRCAPDAMGCLVESSTDCTSSGRVCDDSGTPMCAMLPDECAALPNACAAPGTSCDGETLVLCAENADGCLVETRTDCSERADGTCESSALGTRCEFDGDPCEGIEECELPSTLCEGTVLVDCSEDAFGCLVETRTDCSDEEFGFCDADADPPVCDVGTEDPCEGVDECPAIGSVCDANTLVACAIDGFGCQVETRTDCTASGGTCGAVDGSSACIPPDPECDISRPGRTIGSACSRGACLDSMMCFPETSAATVLVDAVNPDGTPAPSLSGELWPSDGECSVSCNLDEPGDVCGDCATCSGIQIGAIGFIVDVGPAGEPLGLCRSNCTPTTTDNSSCRDGYACNLSSATCQEACTSDIQCRYAVADVDDDGDGDIVYLGASHPASCNLTTGRCTTEGTPGAGAGDPCDEDTDCEDDGVCLVSEDLPDGYCTRLGCNYPGFECAADEGCDVRSLGTAACLVPCTVGAEAEADRLGTTGHGDECAEGMACTWNGLGGPTDANNGSCLPGNYNAVVTPNVGGACQTSADCYSPYGYGRCLWGTDDGALSAIGDEVGSGVCVISHCATFMDAGGLTVEGVLPGVETTTRVCAGAAVGELCVNFGDAAAPFTMCVQSCDAASDCAPGYACAAALAGGDEICWPNCTASSECRAGSTCEDAAGGTCSPLTEACFCSDRVPS